MKYADIYSSYSVLPKFQKVTLPYFLPRSREQEKRAIAREQKCIFEHNLSDDLHDSVCNFIIANSLVELKPPWNFNSLGFQVWEDMVIHRSEGGVDWTAAIHTVSPNGWLPEDVIGKSFVELHQTVPMMKLDNSVKLVGACNQGRFQRFVVGCQYDDRTNFHPRFPPTPFNPSNPILFVRIETQIIVGFPSHSAFLFILRQEIIPESAIDIPVLFGTIQSMTPEQRVYKGIPNELISYLAEHICS